MDKKEYFLGLDMGTNSVGWAVTDSEYVLEKAKGNDLWGIREFDRAENAVERRTHRVSRRNRQRSQVRTGLLKSFFEEAIIKEDPDFFTRLDNSFYREEDKDSLLNTHYAIFADKDYTDKDYYREYPTIFHLKYDLIMDKVEADSRYARKVYLALLNYFKRRGHFLNEGLSGKSEEIADVWTSFQKLNTKCMEILDCSFPVDENVAVEIKNFFAENSKGMSKSRRRDELMAITGTEKKEEKYTQKFLVLTAVCGLKADLTKLLEIDSEKKAELEFSSSGFEEKLPEIYDVIGEGYSPLVEAMKEMYDSMVLSAIMSGNDENGNSVKWLSQARKLDYDKHKRDLKILKTCIRKYCDEDEYDFLFREDTDESYSAYIGSVNGDAKKRRGQNLSKSKSGERYEKLRKRIKKDLGQYTDDKDVSYILSELDAETFLPKQLTFANGVIPNQLHEREVRQILKNASKYLPFLNKADETGLTVQEKIIKLFTFRIPYFVGPVSQKYKGNGWAVRKAGMENEKIYPWNIEEVIDYNDTNEEFITRMVRECTYISGERALPKESMEYQAFMVLNTINNLKIKDEKISCALKQDIYRDIFERKNKVTKKNILDYLNKRGYAVDDSELTGVDSVIGCTLSTYRKFRDVFEEDINKDGIRHMIENIVFMGTVHGDSKKMFKKQITDKYGDNLTEEQIKRIIGFKFKDWGNLSKQFLELNGINKSTGELTSLIRALWEDEDNLNMMELLHSDKYTFGDNLNEKHKEGLKTLSEFTYDDLQSMYFSAPVKRMIWQTLLIIKEVEKIMGCPPKKVFVEMTRSEEEIKGDAGRKDSREKELLALYKAVKDDREWDKEIKDAGASGRLRSKKMYLYYKQLGCDMYTGLPIDLSELFDDNKYDIDHIYPRHFVKDDSIHNNLVLVDKRKNSRKSDNYPLDKSIREDADVINLWNTLKEKKFISDEKYRRLTAVKSFTDEQKADFISRQLVETSQATKGVNDLLKELLPENTILVYAKAKNVSDFRNEFEFYKSRTINDFHHAHDAYLNIVVGNAYYTKFTASPLNFIKNAKEDYNLGKMFDRDIVRNGYTAWAAPKKDEIHNIIEDGKTLSTIRKTLGKNTPLLTRLNITQHGAISDLNIVGADKAKEGIYIPIKSDNKKLSDVEKYGGFNSVKNAYMFLVEHEIAGKGKDKGRNVKIRTLECLPIYKQAQVESCEDGLYEYCLELGLKNPSIRMDKIKFQSLVKVEGFPLYITGKKLERFIVRNACNMILNAKWNKYIHDLDKYNTSNIIGKFICTEKNLELYDELLYKHCSGIYGKRPNSIAKILYEGREKFELLSIDRQIYILTQILNLSCICNSATADLREIGGNNGSGEMAISKKISNFSKIVLVNQSVTGVYEKEVDLLKV